MYFYFLSDLDSRFSLVGSTSSLRITRIQEQDGGTYQCRAENREDSMDASALIEIQVRNNSGFNFPFFFNYLQSIK